MAVKHFYSFEGDNRKFDNVMDAVTEATITAASERRRVKVYRAVLYTHSTEPVVSTLTIIEVPEGIDAGMIADPKNFVAQPSIGGTRREAPIRQQPHYPSGETASERALTPSLPPQPQAAETSLTKPWKPCYSCGRKK